MSSSPHVRLAAVGIAYAAVNPPVDPLRATGQLPLPRFAVVDLPDMRCLTDDPVEAAMFASGRGGDAVVVTVHEHGSLPTDAQAEQRAPWMVELIVVNGKPYTDRIQGGAVAETLASIGRHVDIVEAVEEIRQVTVRDGRREAK